MRTLIIFFTELLMAALIMAIIVPTIGIINANYTITHIKIHPNVTIWLSLIYAVNLGMRAHKALYDGN